ncbi:hypothetical protein GGX14DRAFT_393188 [Mycena pura]|uniref:Uncharacterized protein n=1 Tax=Mycena pura TaxID=153505 RepID=A0AAD6YGU5_9AGAR|nr:hypothetical protein GGX14DRAFT_393188 [Mycena pura]
MYRVGKIPTIYYRNGSFFPFRRPSTMVEKPKVKHSKGHLRAFSDRSAAEQRPFAVFVARPKWAGSVIKKHLLGPAKGTYGRDWCQGMLKNWLSTIDTLRPIVVVCTLPRLQSPRTVFLVHDSLSDLRACRDLQLEERGLFALRKNSTDKLQDDRRAYADGQPSSDSISADAFLRGARGTCGHGRVWREARKGTGHDGEAAKRRRWVHHKYLRYNVHSAL